MHSSRFSLLLPLQVSKLVYVKDICDITATPYVARELMLIKVGRASRRKALAWQHTKHNGHSSMHPSVCTQLPSLCSLVLQGPTAFCSSYICDGQSVYDMKCK